MIPLWWWCDVIPDKFNRRYLVASISGNNNNEWEELVILVNMELDYFVMLEAETGTSEHTYIAIDDVSLTEVSDISASWRETKKYLETVFGGNVFTIYHDVFMGPWLRPGTLAELPGSILEKNENKSTFCQTA